MITDVFLSIVTIVEWENKEKLIANGKLNF